MIMLLLWLMDFSSLMASFYMDHHRGWHWYEPTSLDPVERADTKKSVQKSVLSIVSRYKKDLEEALAQAWLHPTPENMKAYQVLQKDMLDRSQLFSHVWMQSVLSHPELDHTLVVPINQKARHIHLDQEKQKTKAIIQSLAKDYGLFFFFKGRCEYCHTFAPIVQAFAKEHRWDVLAISMDGSVCETFPGAIANNGLAETWNVKVLPALFAVNPHTGHVIPVAYGMVSAEDIVDRLMILVDQKGEP